MLSQQAPVLPKVAASAWCGSPHHRPSGRLTCGTTFKSGWKSGTSYEISSLLNADFSDTTTWAKETHLPTSLGQWDAGVQGKVPQARLSIHRAVREKRG
jgi:hypothetical protein